MSVPIRGTLDDWRYTRSGYQISKIDGVTYKTLFDLAALKGLKPGVTVEFEIPKQPESTGDPYPQLPYANILRVVGEKAAHATVKTDTTDDFTAYLAANGVELGRPGAAKGAIRIGNSTAFVKESTDPTTGAIEITIKHQSSRGTSRQRFTSRQRALTDIQRAEQLLRRMAGSK